MKLGSINISDLKLGSTQVNAVRHGINLIWQKQAPAPQFLLELSSSTAQAGYSIARKIHPNHTLAFRVRNNSNTELNIGFTPEDLLDEAALLNHCGTGNGFITIIYDPSGNGRNITQTIAASQPQIVNAGVINKEKAKPSAYFDGVNDFMRVPSQPATSVKTILIQNRIRTKTTNAIIIEQSINFNNNIGALFIYLESLKARIATRAFSGYLIEDNANSSIYAASNLSTFKINRSTSIADDKHKHFMAGAEVPYAISRQDSLPIDQIPALEYYLGSRSGGTVYPCDLSFSEMLMYNEEPQNLAGLENNINAFYI